MTRYSFFSENKLNDLLNKFINQPNEITVSEKLILIGNLSEKLNKQTGTIVNTINSMILKDNEIRTSIAPSTLNNLLSDLLMFFNNSIGTGISLSEKYDYLDITIDMNKKYNLNVDKILTYKPTIKSVKYNDGFINGKNDELNSLIKNVNLDLIIKIYILLETLTYA